MLSRLTDLYQLSFPLIFLAVFFCEREESFFRRWVVTLVIQSIILGRLVRVRVHRSMLPRICRFNWKYHVVCQWRSWKKTPETLGCVIPGLEIPLIWSASLATTSLKDHTVCFCKTGKKFEKNLGLISHSKTKTVDNVQAYRKVVCSNTSHLEAHADFSDCLWRGFLILMYYDLLTKSWFFNY